MEEAARPTSLHRRALKFMRLELDFDVLDQDSDNVDDGHVSHYKGSDATVVPALMRLREDQKRQPFFS